MPHFEVSLDEFLESANEAVLSQKKSVNELLAKAERTLTKKLKTKGDCEDMLSLINSQGSKFNDCLKILASARNKYDTEKMSKADFNETTKNAIVLLKKNCNNLQIKLGNVVSDTKAVTAQDIADFKEYLTGLKKIVTNRLKYLNSMPASESAFSVDDEENFSKHWIFAKEGDGTEDTDMDDPMNLGDDDKDDDKKSKKSKSKKDSDSDDDEDEDDDKKKSKKDKDDEDDLDDSESGFSDGEDPDDKKKSKKDKDDEDDDKDDDEECDDDECDGKKCKKSKKKDDDESDSDDDDEDDDKKSESKESALFNTVLENFVKNTNDFGKEAAYEQFFSDCEYLRDLDPCDADEAIAKENAIMMLNNRRNNEEVTMESISIVSALMDNYVYNCENFGVDAANEQLAYDVSSHEAAAMEGNVGREAQKIYKAGLISQKYEDKSDDIKDNAYTKKDLARAERYANKSNNIYRKAIGGKADHTDPKRGVFSAGYNTCLSTKDRTRAKDKYHDCCNAAKAGAIAGKLQAKAAAAADSGLVRKANRYNSTAEAIEDKYSGKTNNAFAAYTSACRYGKYGKNSTKESAILDELCENFIYNEDNYGLETAFAYLESDLDNVEMPEIEAIAMEAAPAPVYNGTAAFVGGSSFNTPGNYRMQNYATGDWVSNAIDARLSNDTRVARDTCASINKSDAKKMAAIANKMTKLNTQKKTADDDKKKAKIDAKLRKLKLSADAINATRKTMGMDPLTFESALAAYDSSDPIICAYENVLDEIISRVDDYDFDGAMEGSDKFIMSPGDYSLRKNDVAAKDVNDLSREKHWITTGIAKRINPDNLQDRLNYKFAEKSDKKDLKKMAAAAKKMEKLKLKAAKETNPKQLAKLKVQIKKLGAVASSINNARKQAGLDPIAFEAAVSANVNVFDGSFHAYDEALEMLINTEDDLSAEFCDLDYED